MAQVLDATDQLDIPREDEDEDEDFDAFGGAKSIKVPQESAGRNIVIGNGDITGGGVKNTVQEKRTDPLPPGSPTKSDNVALNESDSSGFKQMDGQFVTPKDFDLLKVIGMGAFGKVLQVRHKHTQRILAMKVISKRLLQRKSGYIENIQAERKILTRVQSAFVVTMHCSFQTKEKLFIIMDFLAGGELFLRLGRSGIFLEATAAFYLAEIILALDHLHSLGILHRDLKPENILLGSDGHVCVTDFGLAKDFSDSAGFTDEDLRALTICGTQEYMAPEMLSRQGYGKAADYWSLGCIAYEMLSGLPPFSSKKGAKELFRRIMSEKVKMPVGSTASACKLLKGLLCRNVLARLGTTKSTMFEIGGVAALKKLDFFRGINWEKLERKEVEPPQTLEVDNHEDLKHFHEEFTGMALPRSVLEMSKEDFRPRRVQSGAFRGFSFIQEDFALPKRNQDEIRSYWDSVEEDGESVSDAASSKLEFDSRDLPEPITTPTKKKRPPRKRKKKKANGVTVSAASTPAVSTDNSPSVSAVNTPVPSENGDTEQVEKGELLVDTLRQVTLDTRSVDKAEIKQFVDNPLTSPTPPQRPPSPVKQEQWQSAASKKKRTPKKNTPNTVSRGKVPPRATTPGAQNERSKPVASTDWQRPKIRQTPAQTPPAPPRYQKSPAGSTPGAWSNTSTPQSAGTSSSSDWRQHSMSPRSLQRSVQHQSPPAAPSAWPTLSSSKKNNESLRGAWAAKK